MKNLCNTCCAIISLIFFGANQSYAQEENKKICIYLSTCQTNLQGFSNNFTMMIRYEDSKTITADSVADDNTIGSQLGFWSQNRRGEIGIKELSHSCQSTGFFRCWPGFYRNCHKTSTKINFSSNYKDEFYI